MWTSGRSIANWRRRATWRPMWCWRRIASIIAAAGITHVPKCHADAVSPTIIDRIGLTADIKNPLHLNCFSYDASTSPDTHTTERKFETIALEFKTRQPNKNKQ